MKFLWLTLVGLLALGCEISPVVTNPEMPNNRYSDCERAAESYCELSLEATRQEMDACVAKYRFQCVSRGAKAASTPRS